MSILTTLGGGLQRSASISAALAWPHRWTQHLQLTRHASASHELAGRIISNLSESGLSSEHEVVCQRWTAAGFDLVVQPKSQRCWSRIAAASKLAEVRSMLRPQRLTRISAASQPHSGDCLEAIPIGKKWKSSLQ